MTLADPASAAAVLGGLATFLLHSTLWIGGAWLVQRFVDSAAWRERLWRGALAGGLVTTVLVTSLATPRLSWRWQRAAAAVARAQPTPGRPIVLQGAPTVVTRSVSPPPGLQATLPEEPSEPGQSVGGAGASTARHLEPALLGLWLLGAALGLAHLGLSHLRLGHALRNRRAIERGALVDSLASLTERAGLRRRPRLSTSDVLASPIALARGEIVVPERALARLAPGELETLLAHELAHVARRDPWWLLGLNVLRRLFWPQALLALVTARSMEAAELCCDELAARWTRKELALARCLAEVATWIGGRPASRLVAGMAERPSALVERVERLLAPRRASRAQGVLVGGWLAAMLAVVGCEGPRVGAEAPEPAGPQHESEATPGAEPGSNSANLGRVAVIFSDPSGRATALQEEIVRKRAQQAGLKPAHSRWLKLEKEIQDLEAQRDQVLLRMRLDAGEQGHVDASGGSKLHVATITQGGVSMSTAAPHALRLHADGSIDCVTTQLVPPEGEDDSALVAHLEQIALGMDRVPLDPADPDGFQVPDGRLRILIDVDAPHSLLQRCLRAGSLLQVQIWKFSLVPVVDGKPGEAMPFALPHDLGEIPAAVEEDAPTPRTGPVRVTLRVIGDGKPGELHVETELDEQGRLQLQSRLGRTVEYSVGRRTVLTTDGEGASNVLFSRWEGTDLAGLREALTQAYARAPTERVVIDALPGTLYADVVALLDVVIATGFTDIVFTGRRE